MTAMAVVLFSATANANTISVRCSDDVQRGTVKLTNPPTMNCADLELIQKYIGSGVTVGPDSKVNELVSAIEKIKPKSVVESKFSNMSRHDEWFNPEPIRTAHTPTNSCDNGWINLKLEDDGVTIRR